MFIGRTDVEVETPILCVAAVQLKHSLAAVLPRLLTSIVIERQRAVVVDGIAL